jgi:hypothetical protein
MGIPAGSGVNAGNAWPTQNVENAIAQAIAPTTTTDMQTGDGLTTGGKQTDQRDDVIHGQVRRSIFMGLTAAR